MDLKGFRKRKTTLFFKKKFYNYFPVDLIKKYDPESSSMFAPSEINTLLFV